MKRQWNLIFHLNGATFWIRWYLWLWRCSEVRSGFLPSTQEGLFRVVPATFPGKHEHLTVWERSSMRFLLQHRWAAMTSHVPPSVDAETHTRTSVAHMRYITFDTFDTVKKHIPCIWRNTHFSNAHLSYKQISHNWPSTVEDMKHECSQ